ncbi:unnamed protein product, partial [Tetraodon nigroviridis]
WTRLPLPQVTTRIFHTCRKTSCNSRAAVWLCTSMFSRQIWVTPRWRSWVSSMASAPSCPRLRRRPAGSPVSFFQECHQHLHNR